MRFGMELEFLLRRNPTCRTYWELFSFFEKGALVELVEHIEGAVPMNKTNERMEPMKNFIGGLYKNREDADMARKALRENEFDESSLNLLECTHDRDAVVLKENPRIQSIAAAALIGALVLGGLGGILGLLVGLGIITPPGLEPQGGATLPFEITWQYTFTSVVTGLIFGGVTGAILGVAARLLMAKYKKVDTGQAADKGDLMLAVEANDMRRETKARSIMKEYGAVKFEEFRDTWDTEIWSVYDEEVPQTS